MRKVNGEVFSLKFGSNQFPQLNSWDYSLNDSHQLRLIWLSPVSPENNQLVDIFVKWRRCGG